MNAQKEAAKWRKTLANLAAKHDEASANLEAIKKRKSALVLRAHGSGHEASRDKLVGLNRSVVSATVEIDDIALAICQAQVELEAAEQIIAEAQEAERLSTIAGLAEKRIDAAHAVDGCADALAETISVWERLGVEILAHMPRHDDPDRKPLVNMARLQTALAEKLGALGLARNVQNPLTGQSLADLEADYLQPLILSDEGIARTAAMRAMAFASNVIDYDQQKASSAA